MDDNEEQNAVDGPPKEEKAEGIISNTSNEAKTVEEAETPCRVSPEEKSSEEESPENDSDQIQGEPICFKVVCNKKKYDIEFPLEGTIKQLKSHLSPIINILPTMQKIMIKGLAKDEKTLKELGIVKGAKVMVVGSTLTDVVNINANTSTTAEMKTEVGSLTTKESFSKQKVHKKILDKGVPEDANPGIKNCRDTLPMSPLSGMLNKRGGKLRLTFKLETDQVWIGTKERTEKITMSNIQSVVSEPIEGHEEYHIMYLQLGPTEGSRYWIYWVPAQYVEAIKGTVLGKW